MGFHAPVAEMIQAMRVAGLNEVLAVGTFGDLDGETVRAVLEEAARFATAELVPINRIGDRVGARRDGERVVTPPGWAAAYAVWIASGWNGVGAPTVWGGQKLPVLLQMALQEQWNGACASFATGAMLTAGAIDALLNHGDSTLKQRFLPRLVSGEVMATMNLTEPQAGSDLGALKTRAERAADGSYRIFGQKTFITFGDHDLTDNIVHLVLARLPDAPAGTAGISLFLVPKILEHDDDRHRESNDVVVAGLEQKLGLHGAPTCSMIYGERGGGAVGWLIGEEHRGLACMFTMMNFTRLNVGIQGVGIAERAYQDALAYARQRRQGRAPGAPRGVSSPIVDHPDIQRTLLCMKSLVAAGRVICYRCAAAIDMSNVGPAQDRPQWAGLAALLTPIAKAFSTDAATEVASLGIQVHGGAGYIEETGAAQHLRDARVFSIYEGTNGIQAIDLVTRKLSLAGGVTVNGLIAEIENVAGASGINRDGFGRSGAHLSVAAAALRDATGYLSTMLAEDRGAEALAGATPYLRLFGLALGGALLARAALDSDDHGDAVALARFFAETFVLECPALAKVVIEGASGLERAASKFFANTGQNWA